MATVGVAGTSGGVHSLRALPGVVVVVALALLIRLDGAGLAQIVTTLGRARYWWLIPAIVAEAMSMGAMAAQQRQLLGVQGARHPLRTVAATTLASNTISTSLPIVGSPAAAVYAYKRYAKLGGGGAVAGWALAVTGICSSLALATIVALGGILSGNLAASLVGGLAIVLGVVPLGVGLLMLQRRVVCRCVERIGIAATSVLHRVLRRRLGEKISVVRCVQRVATLRLTRRDAARVFASSLLNWLLDMACLGCAILALDGNVPWQKLVLVWAAGAGASSFHLTPGGLGVVEAALTLALVGAGARVHRDCRGGPLPRRQLLARAAGRRNGALHRAVATAEDVAEDVAEGIGRSRRLRSPVSSPNCISTGRCRNSCRRRSLAGLVSEWTGPSFPPLSITNCSWSSSPAHYRLLLRPAGRVQLY